MKPPFAHLHEPLSILNDTRIVCRLLAVAATAVALTGLACEGANPKVVAVSENTVVTSSVDGNVPMHLAIGDSTGEWTFMGVIQTPESEAAAVFEDFSRLRGRIVIATPNGIVVDLPKSLAPSAAEITHPYRGHTLEEVQQSEHDLLGSEILAHPGDPSFEEVAACLPPIVRMFTYTFVGTQDSFDKVGFAYGGRSPAFDPAILVPEIRRIRAEEKVADGLVGGWLPVVRFVYPEESGSWTEMLAFAPMRMVDDNRWSQPVWYRVARVENNRLAWIQYFDTFVPFPPRTTQPPARFYKDLLTMKAGWEKHLEGGMRISLPDARLADMARHSLVRAMITRIGVEPKYGVVDRNYGGTEHDGFPDTFNTDTGTLCDWGLLHRAGEYIDNYLGRFVRNDGALLYRGPETGQYGRMLTVLAQYANHGGDPEILLQHRRRIDAIANLLLSLRRKAQELPPSDPAYGMIAGWSEADSSLDPDPARYMQPYFGNSTEAARGFHDLGGVWQRLGQERHDPGLEARGVTLVREADSLERDIQQAITRSLLSDSDPVCLPAIAGAPEPPHIAVVRDPLDPLHRSYRSYMEMQFSGDLTRDQVGTIIRYRAAHHDSILGLPTAYGIGTCEVAGFLTYGQAYGLLQHDFVREYLVTLYSMMAHQNTRGTWTAPETRKIDLTTDAAPYCVPAQLVVPMMTRWMLAFEDPRSETLWLAKATPRDWLEDGKTISALDVPTKWGRVDFAIHSHLAGDRIEAEVTLPADGFNATLVLRLRVPADHTLGRVVINGELSSDFDPNRETIVLGKNLAGRVLVEASYDPR